VSEREAVAGSEASHRLIRRVLRGGLLVGVTLMVAGLAIDIAMGTSISVPMPLASFLDTGSIGDRTMALGVLSLALTPVVRVAALVLVWRREKDTPFVAVGLAVLVILVVGMLAGRA